MKRFETVDEYIAAAPDLAQERLNALRSVVKEVAPQAGEVISYGMPAFKWHGMLVWYGAHKDHIGFYPKAAAIAAFSKDLAGYKTSKGAIQFPIENDIPTSLVRKIVKFRLKENKQHQNSAVARVSSPAMRSR
jgi:uncharacterized protein YdhG (YjbR/CyaY superfamily)